jgi:hypothetical protein
MSTPSAVVNRRFAAHLLGVVSTRLAPARAEVVESGEGRPLYPLPEPESGRGL